MRHAESVFSARGVVSGDPAVAGGLTDAGREQARQLASVLEDERIDLCVVTDFERVGETADIALAGREVPRLVVPELNDIRFGEFEGGAFDEYRAWARAKGPADDCPGGGESRAAAAARFVRGWRIVAARPEERILVVGHGLPIRYLLDALEGVDPAPVLEQVPYASVFRLAAPELERAVARLEEWAAAPAWA
ncbi:MAG: hypothetical protein QOE36_660 [Gaiellaceae bacterium]|nr:hypothetical protein [Gaiellaceae bacterium]